MPEIKREHYLVLFVSCMIPSKNNKKKKIQFFFCEKKKRAGGEEAKKMGSRLAHQSGGDYSKILLAQPTIHNISSIVGEIDNQHFSQNYQPNNQGNFF